MAVAELSQPGMGSNTLCQIQIRLFPDGQIQIVKIFIVKNSLSNTDTNLPHI